MNSTLKRTRFLQTLNHWRKLARHPSYRDEDRRARASFETFCSHAGALGLRHYLLPKTAKRRTALFVRGVSLPYAPVEALIIKAFQMAGFEPVVLGDRQYSFMRYDWLAGSKTALELTDFDGESDRTWLDEQMGGLSTLRDWLNLTYQGVHVGRLVMASAMRRLKVGQIDFSNHDVRRLLRELLDASVSSTLAGTRLFEKLKPDCALFFDYGYSGQGELFDLAIARGVDALAWNFGYKSNRLAFKRFNSRNRREHYLAPSDELWRRVCSMPWKPEYGRSVRQELFQCYKSQDWFSKVGTQFDTRLVPRQTVYERLGLTSEKKVAVVFPHILWDGSFFTGEDLFDDYTHWLVETIRAACANTRLQWVVKLHPGHVVKSRQENDPGTVSELDVIQKEFGSLPGHIKLVYPDNDVSTYSVLEVADYVVTVRGTVGIEAALRGIPVVTAGTSRYDRRGFTLDSTTPREYLDRLATLESHPRLSERQVELAERYAYAVFFCRPLPLTSASLEFARDGKATPKVTIHCQTREQWLAAADMQKLAAWIADGQSEDLLAFPPEAGPVGG